MNRTLQIDSIHMIMHEGNYRKRRKKVSSSHNRYFVSTHRVDSTDSDTVTGAMSRSSTMTIDDQTLEDLSKGSSSPTDEGKLLVVQFTVDKMSLEVSLLRSEFIVNY